jgi:hypothetical protein
MARNSQHVIPHLDGGWSVVKDGSIRSTRRFDTQKAAISYARRLSKAQGSELYVHGRDGLIRSRDSYGNDPFLPHDKR